MIDTQTVLILGAGASAQLKYPIGSGLQDEIIKGIETDDSWKGLFIELGHSQQFVNDFHIALKKSDFYSIDLFLERNPDFSEIGKQAIARALLPFEDPELPFRQPTWYKILKNHLNARLSEISQNKLSIITFNYDRSLEFYLFETFKHSYPKVDQDSVTEQLLKIPIIHVHGKLNNLPWEGGDNARNYEVDYSPIVIKQAAAGIKIIYETAETDSEFLKAREKINDASRVFFLGMAYHPDNMKRLGFPLNIPIEKEIAGSSYKLGDSKMKHCKTTYKIEFYANQELNIDDFFHRAVLL